MVLINDAPRRGSNRSGCRWGLPRLALNRHLSFFSQRDVARWGSAGAQARDVTSTSRRTAEPGDEGHKLPRGPRTDYVDVFGEDCQWARGNIYAPGSALQSDGVAEVRVAFIEVDGVELTTARSCVPEDVEPIADVDHIDQSVFDDGVAPHHNLVQSLA